MLLTFVTAYSLLSLLLSLSGSNCYILSPKVSQSLLTATSSSNFSNFVNLFPILTRHCSLSSTLFGSLTTESGHLVTCCCEDLVYPKQLYSRPQTSSGFRETGSAIYISS